ncbi:MAG: RNA methyltransferase [Eubacterium sp.]|nr:RNA methyltransferase [Candidatus Colimonas fimequi]
MSNLIYPPFGENKDIEMYVGNREVRLRRYFEPEPGVFIAESHNVIELALNQGFQPMSAVVLEKRLDDPLLERLDHVPVYVMDEELVKETFGYVLPGGISCAMRRRDNQDYRLIFENAKRIIVLENVENPTNVGAIFRTAAALGVEAVLLSAGCADPMYRRAMRVAVGNTLLVPWAYVGKTETYWQEKGVEILKDAGFTTVAMALRNDNLCIDDPVLKGQERIAIIMGNEGEGLTESTIEACDYVAKIPMADGVDSLNVAVAAGLVMWEMMK